MFSKEEAKKLLEKEEIDIYNRDTWSAAHKFMYENMMKLETFYEEYRDFFKYG